MLGQSRAVVDTPWPKVEASLIEDHEVTIAIQVNGKRRDEVRVGKGLSARQVEDIVVRRDAVIRAIEGKPIRKVIVVPDRIANIVV